MSLDSKRSGSAIAVLAAVLSCAAASLSCNSPAAEKPPPPLRLADERHRSTDSGPALDVPTGVVGGVRRPVLAPARPALILRSVVEAEPGSTVKLTAPVDERLRRGPIRFDATVKFLGVKVPDAARGPIAQGGRLLGSAPDARAAVAPRGRTGARAQEELAVTLPATDEAKRGDVLIEIFARPAEPAWTSAAIQVPKQAVLRFGVALDPADGTAENGAPITAQIRVLEEGREEDLFRVELDPRTPSERRSWQDHEVDLSAYAGRRVALEFSGSVARREADAAASGPLVLWSDPVITASDVGTPLGEHDRRPNLVLISLDTLRPDHLGAYGYARPTSPAIDAELAARGTLFEHAYTSFPHTAGSHMTMLTAVDPCVHGLSSTAWSGAVRVKSGLVTLAEVLRGAGYDTAAFTENAWVTAALGYDRGFATFVEDSGVALDQGNVDTTFARALAWIEHERTAPFFAFIHTYQVHEPYTPPRAYLESVAPEHGNDRASLEAAQYDGEIRYTDDVVARFLAALDERHLSDGTLIVLTADHGQHFGEHGFFGHGNTLYDTLLHVPLVLRGPGVPAGKRVSESVGLIDLMPTVLDLLGLAPPGGLQGLSLTGTLRGEPLAQRTLYAELSERGLLAARQGDRKLLLNQKTGQHSAFEFRRDPEEKDDLGASIGAAQWQDALAAHQRHCDHPSARAGDPPAPGPGIDARVRGKLEALGYTE